jgi:hypothetical protein
MMKNSEDYPGGEDLSRGARPCPSCKRGSGRCVCWPYSPLNNQPRADVYGSPAEAPASGRAILCGQDPDKWNTGGSEAETEEYNDFLDRITKKKTLSEISVMFSGVMSLSEKFDHKKRLYLTPKEKSEVAKAVGTSSIDGCSVAKEKSDSGYYFYTHRARSKAFERTSDVTKKAYDFICSTS